MNFLPEKLGWSIVLYVLTTMGHLGMISACTANGTEDPQSRRGSEMPHGRRSTVKSLIELGADINSKDKNGSTALMRSAALGHTKLVEELLSHGADTGTRDKNGSTALSVANSSGHRDVVELLKSTGVQE